MSDGRGDPDSTDLFRMLVEGPPVVAYIDASTPDPSYRPTTAWVSPRIEQLTGYTQEEWVDTRPWLTVLHPDVRDWVLDLHLECLESGAERFEAEYRLVRRDGSVVWVRDVESLVLGPDGSTPRRQGSWEDITGRMRDDERRHRSERLHRVMAESVPDGGSHSSTGLDSISERVRLAGGRFAIHSTPGEGTILSVSLPVGRPAPI